jgi:hypothetical protein
MVCNEKWKVDAKFDDVADILPGKENVHIKVRVLRLWKFPAFLNPVSLALLRWFWLMRRSMIFTIISHIFGCISYMVIHLFTDVFCIL